MDPEPTSAPSNLFHLDKQKDHRTAIVLIVIFCILIAIASWMFFKYHTLTGTSHSQSAFTGSLILGLPSVWTSPSGEKIQGLVSYTPSTHATFLVEGPMLATTHFNFSPVSVPFSSDLYHLLALRESTTSEQLVSVSLSQQMVEHTVLSSNLSSVIAGPLYSPDTKLVAYSILEPSTSVGTTYVSSVDGSSKIMVGKNLPISFSPDSSKVLMNEHGGGEVVSVDGKTHTTLQNSASLEKAKLVRVSPNGAIMAVVDTSGTKLTMYAVNWKTPKLTETAHMTIPANAQISFTSKNLLVVFDSVKNIFSTYTASRETLALQNSFTLDLPAGSKLIDVK